MEGSMGDKTGTLMNLISKSVQCKVSTIVESEEEVKWYPILQFATQGFTMGVKEDYIWVFEAKSVLYHLENPNEFWRLVILLEQPLNEIKKEVTEFFNSLNFIANPDDFFPFIEITQAGFQFGTKYWAELAFNWYDEIPLEKKVYLKESLKNVENAKWASQKLRHRARKELKLLS